MNEINNTEAGGLKLSDNPEYFDNYSCRQRIRGKWLTVD